MEGTMAGSKAGLLQHLLLGVNAEYTRSVGCGPTLVILPGSPFLGRVPGVSSSSFSDVTSRPAYWEADTRPWAAP